MSLVELEGKARQCFDASLGLLGNGNSGGLGEAPDDDFDGLRRRENLNERREDACNQTLLLVLTDGSENAVDDVADSANGAVAGDVVFEDFQNVRCVHGSRELERAATFADARKNLVQVSDDNVERPDVARRLEAFPDQRNDVAVEELFPVFAGREFREIELGEELGELFEELAGVGGRGRRGGL